MVLGMILDVYFGNALIIYIFYLNYYKKLYFNKIHTTGTLIDSVRQWAGSSVNAGEVWISDVGAVLVDSTASCCHQEQTTNSKSRSNENWLDLFLSRLVSYCSISMFAKLPSLVQTSAKAYLRYTKE